MNTPNIPPTEPRIAISDYILAAVTVCLWTIMGTHTPWVKEIYEDFDPYGKCYSWLFLFTKHLHWSWTIPLGILSGGLLLFRHSYAGKKRSRQIMVIGWIAVPLLLVLWAWSLISFRFVTYT